MSKKISLSIDGKDVEVEEGTSVFEAAVAADVFVPHYCYHPDLSVAGVCRMCMVEIDNIPKLQISCNTPAREGMVVHTKSEKARAAQTGSLELHLINHPLDCPICDKAGECKLQDIYRGIGLYKSRMELDNKVHKPKVVDIGTIVLDSERCILCSRCTRFTDEVTDTHELIFVNRGDRTTLKTYDDGPLRNDYTGNLADICPVGALTAKDFRFQQRVWFLDKQKSVCTFCARGCNTEVSYNPKTKELYRVEPRRNPEVNKSWICDTGRWEYNHIYSDSRIQFPRLKGEGKTADITWHEALGKMQTTLRGDNNVIALLSAQLTNEEAFDIVDSLGGLGDVTFGVVADAEAVGEKEPFDGILKHRDLTPNFAGVTRVLEQSGKTWFGPAEIKQRLSGASHVWLLGLEGEEVPWAASFFQSGVPEHFVVHATNYLPWMEEATLLLPNTSGYEKSGTLVNALGRLQKLQQAIPTLHTARDGHRLSVGIVAGGDRVHPDEYRYKKTFEKKVSSIFFNEAKAWKAVDPMGEVL